MLRLINAHEIELPAEVIDAFWSENNFNELISINGSEYQIAKCEEVCKECFCDPKSINAFYLIDDKNPETIIGFGKIDIDGVACQIIFSIAEWHREQRLGTKLCKLLIKKCWEHKVIKEIIISCSDYNIPVEKIAQASGFTFKQYSGVGTECDGLGHLNYSLKKPKKRKK